MLRLECLAQDRKLLDGRKKTTHFDSNRLRIFAVVKKKKFKGKRHSLLESFIIEYFLMK